MALCEGQRRTPNPPELGLQVVVSHPTWALGTENGSFANGKCAYALSHLTKTLTSQAFITRKSLNATIKMHTPRPEDEILG